MQLPSIRENVRDELDNEFNTCNEIHLTKSTVSMCLFMRICFVVRSLNPSPLLLPVRLLRGHVNDFITCHLFQCKNASSRGIVGVRFTKGK